MKKQGKYLTPIDRRAWLAKPGQQVVYIPSHVLAEYEDDEGRVPKTVVQDSRVEFGFITSAMSVVSVAPGTGKVSENAAGVFVRYWRADDTVTKSSAGTYWENLFYWESRRQQDVQAVLERL